MLGKLSAFIDRNADERDRLYRGTIGEVKRIKPKILPWHSSSLSRHYNRRWLRRMVDSAVSSWPTAPTVMLAANPVAVYYADSVRCDVALYLRLDDYREYPGCDPALVDTAEAMMYERADAVVVTAKHLLPSSPYSAKGYYLPQGVQTENFAGVTSPPPGRKVLGFFGTLAEWLDFDLIVSVAKLAPDWRLEFVGKSDCVPDRMRLPNVSVQSPVHFSRLPEIMSGWTAAWIPFKLNKLTIAVNPLKVREYLAGGLPSHCSPLPEVDPLRQHVHISQDAADIVRWMNAVALEDSPELRLQRRRSVAQDSWRNRAAQLVELARDRLGDQGKTS
jgi:glycosyltransferase involved in cell wall biosynthesis